MSNPAGRVLQNVLTTVKVVPELAIDPTEYRAHAGPV